MSHFQMLIFRLEDLQSKSNAKANEDVDVISLDAIRKYGASNPDSFVILSLKTIRRNKK